MTATKSNNTLQELKTIRDELKVQAHLLKMDSMEEWNILEKKWDKLDLALDPTRIAAGEAASDIGAATGLLMSELSKGYAKIKKALTH